MLTGDSDPELAAAALRGSQEAFVRLHSKYQDGARQVAARYLRCPSLANALVNEAFMRAFSHLHLWNVEKGGFRKWLLAILENLAVEKHRQNVSECRRRSGYLRTRRLYDPGDVGTLDACEFHSERWFLAPVQREISRVLEKLGAERRAWLIELPRRRQLDAEKAALSRARRGIAEPLDLHLSGPALREAVARELLFTKLCGKHAGGALL